MVLSRLRQDVDCILIDAVVGNHFYTAARAIRLRGPSLDRIDTARVAKILVHEATHARIEARGIPYARDQQARHERVCVNAEKRFARKLMDGDALADESEDQLKTPWWTDEERQKRKVREWEELGVPQWLPKLLRRLRW